MKGQITTESKEVGEYAEVTNYAFAPIMNGFTGKVSRVFRTEYLDFENGTFYEITAENYGPYISVAGVQKKVRAWMPNTTHYVKEGQFRFI